MKKQRTIFPKAKKGGSFTVEAALVAPLFFLALAAILFLIRLDLVQENTMFQAVKEAKNTALAAHFLPVEEDPLLQELYTIKEYSVKVPLAFFTDQSMEFREILRYRSFTGMKNNGTPMDFSEMETAEDSEAVWVFPRRGERYHLRECRIVTVYPEERLLSAALKKKYTPCENCDPETLSSGTPVYCFPTGEVYHSGNCAAVERYVVPINLKKAEEQGYTPCSYCNP